MKRIFTSMVALALIGTGAAYAQTDVTSTYITNPGFESSTGETGNIATAETANSKDYTDTGWKNVDNAAWGASAVIVYGSGQINGVDAPAADNAGNTGNALGISVGWGGSVTYQSATAVTLPAGTYTLTAHVYNANTSAQQFASKLGFVPTAGGTASLSSKKSFASGTWETDEVTFILSEATEGVFQVGGTAISGGSGSNAKLLIDNLTLQKITTLADGTDLTSKIANPSFEEDIATGWTQDGSISFVRQGNNSFGKSGSQYAEHWQPNGTLNIYQNLTSLPAGIYRLTVKAKARGVTSAAVYVDDAETNVTIADSESDYNVTFQSTGESGQYKIGFKAEGTGAGSSWVALDNFRLTYVSATLPDVTAVTGKMNSDVSKAQDNAVSAYSSNKTFDNYKAALTAIDNATASIAAYSHAKSALDSRAELMNVANFYKADDSFYTTPNAAYEAGTLTNEEANALEDPYGTSKIGWHASTQINQFFGAAWGFSDYTGALYVNTWSVEGDTDDSNFKVPFYEYWTGDANTLADRTLTGTISGLTANTSYTVSATVRVRLSNGQSAPAVGITMQVGDGTPTEIVGTQIKDSQLYIADYTATGNTDANGNLSLKFNIASTNVSWLAFQHVKYEAATATGISSVKGEGTAVADGAAYNLAGQRVGKNYKGVVIVNGKKVIRK